MRLGHVWNDHVKKKKKDLDLLAQNCENSNT